MANHSGNDGDTNCTDIIPVTSYLYGPGLTTTGLVLVIVASVSFVLTHVCFIEQLIRLRQRWPPSSRRHTTTVMLSLGPFISGTAYMAYIVPRAGVLVDLLVNGQVAYGLSNYLLLLESYFGSVDKLCETLGGATIPLKGPPCCCCCVCLPTIPLNRISYMRLRDMVLWCSGLRPVVMVIAAVLWANGDYAPGLIAVNNGFVYVTLINLILTLLAMYGLLKILGLTKHYLQEEKVAQKMVHMKAVLILPVLTNLIISILTRFGAIPCTIHLPSKSRSERIYHLILVFLMLPLTMLTRYLYIKDSSKTYEVEKEEETDRKNHHSSPVEDNPEYAGNGQYNEGFIETEPHRLSPIV